MSQLRNYPAYDLSPVFLGCALKPSGVTVLSKQTRCQNSAGGCERPAGQSAFHLGDMVYPSKYSCSLWALARFIEGCQDCCIGWFQCWLTLYWVWWIKTGMSCIYRHPNLEHRQQIECEPALGATYAALASLYEQRPGPQLRREALNQLIQHTK